jgi:DNA-binding CsgD family transcriptional regulator
VSGPFIGRDEEVRALRALVTGSRRAGAPTAALIAGEPGSGKTRLLREILRDVDPRRTVTVAGFEPIESIPLAAVADLIRRLTAVPDHGPRLEALVFGSGLPRAQTGLPVFEATHRAAAAFGPLIVSVDDLQWLDGQSIALLHYLVRSAEATRHPLVVLAASRPSSGAAAFSDALVAALPDSRRQAIQLHGLPREDGVELLQAIDGRLDREAAEDLWRRAEGSPFWLEALARHRGANDAIELVADRLRALSADAGALLNGLAIGGRPFARDELAKVMDWPSARLDHAAGELVGRGLAVSERGVIRLAHDLIREAAAEVIPADARRDLHKRLARRLQASAGDDLRLLAEALDHRAAGGLQTAELAIRVLRSPQRRLLGNGDLQRLASIADSLPPGSAEQLTIDRELGKLAGILGEQSVSLRHWLRAAGSDPDPKARQRAAWEAALAASRLSRPADARAFLDEALRLAPDEAEGMTRIEALRAEVALWLDHDTDAGAAAATRALAAALEMAARARGIDRLSADARYAYLSALLAGIGAAMQQERFDDGRRLNEESLAVARNLDEETLVEALLRGGFSLRALGAIVEAEAQYREAWEIAHRAVLPFAMIDAGIGLARVLRDIGRLTEALQVATETVELEARLGTPPGRWGNAVATLHMIQMAIGDPRGLDGLRADSRTHPNPHYRLAIHQQIAAWLARFDGRRHQAEIEEHVEAGRSDAELASCPRCGAEMAIVSAEVLARLGRVEDARRLVHAWERRPITDYPRRDLWRAHAAAALAVAEGNIGTASAVVDEVVRGYRREGLNDELLWALLDAGRVRAATDRRAAIESYTEAAALAERFGAVSRGRLASRALRELGVRAWRRGRDAGRDGTPRLSAREHEIAGLVAAGESNRDIADTLGLAPKTVERHLTNILAKLGARNRTELAGLVHTGSVRGSPDD